jgi:hypothetical protein
MSRFISVAVAAAACAALFASAAYGAPPTAHNPVGRILGIVPSHGKATKFSSSGGNLLYHNGPTMHSNTVYAIYWIPPGYSVSSNYVSLINGFFGNVAAASGQTSNVYYSDTQYKDNVNGSILYQSTFPTSNAVVDTDAFPASGCRDSYTAVCLTDSQIQAEISHEITANGWSSNLGNLFFVFTPKNVGSCAGSSCAYSYYCAYHSQIGSGSNATLYANMPYAAFVPSACGSGQSPNNDDADSTINVTSHEHNESITDPLGTAWYDRRGNEDGDKCAWNFGASTGSTSSGSYNQLINGGTYYLQQEWSNHSSRCVLTGT